MENKKNCIIGIEETTSMVSTNTKRWVAPDSKGKGVSDNISVSNDNAKDGRQK